MPVVFLILFFVAAFGVVIPFRGFKRWHFALGAFAAFFGLMITVPKPKPAEIAARKAEREREEKAEAVARVEKGQSRIIERRGRPSIR